MRSIALTLLVALLAVPASAGKTAVEPATANNAFAVDLFGVLRTREGNLFFSPYSVSAALAMTRQGAKGDSAAQIDEVFHWGGGVDAKAHRALAKALVAENVTDGHGEDAKEVPAYEMHVANALWAQAGLPVKKPFAGVLDREFGAPLRRLDFRDTAAARKAINDWVAQQTRDRIRDIVPEDLPTPDTLFALANAIWFKAAWDEPFRERWTKEAPFTTTAGEVFEVALMHRTGDFRYAEDDAVQVVEIPYRGGRTSMLVVLPKKADGLPAVEKALTSAKLAGWTDALRDRQVAVKLPRFEITCPTDLTGTLKGMGMPDAFDGKKADFTGMTDERPLFVGAVLHKAFVKVDEAGTEAAAATVVMMMKGGMPPDPVAFTADHPFLFLIRHRATGLVLFMGRFESP